MARSESVVLVAGAAEATETKERTESAERRALASMVEGKCSENKE